MTADRLYLDHAATTPLLPAAREAMLAGFAQWANPSSPHREGRAARAALEDARARLAEALGWRGEVIFTSGASEALTLALTRCRQPLAAVLSVEHEAVLRHAGDAERLAVDGQGLVDPAAVAAAAAGTGLVAVQQVNNETGVIQPLDAIVAAVRAAGGLLLADCAQSAGKLALPDADLIALSAHKFGGPIGMGALLVRDWALLEPTGGQERGYRAGTENLPGALAMVAALEQGGGWLANAAAMRQQLELSICASGGAVIAAETPRLPTIGAYRMPGISAAAQLIRFDAMGLAVSAGSACSSGSLRTSHVLGAMGLEDKAASEVIRVSIGRETTEADIARFLDAWREIAGKDRTGA
ncbi:cysteine desulfurase family protein [Novosphingobium sp. JCM 18896]|uniref:cysteine desulfurase family protein n=1 Tax=Novosphingobium sp. JCM 18896 TaxID=2989731 RepID=UPI0022236C8D|nr:aminotransferase class V-fold PLP-dependent enzyme [Novosphingobium sp. JCM 18896]MCW1427899.1 aminotransferase class V-fold PLP-dependent enzyme [Novosphingobium sp. JCM 18896]